MDIRVYKCKPRSDDSPSVRWLPVMWTVTLRSKSQQAAARPTPTFSTVSLKVDLILVVLGVLPTVLAHTLYFSSLSSLKSFETATLALLELLRAPLKGKETASIVMDGQRIYYNFIRPHIA